MRILNLLSDFVHDVKAQRLRTTLTILGVTWGTVAVVVLLAFGVGIGAQMKKNSHGLGENIVILRGGQTTRSWRGFNEGRPIRITEDDAAALVREIPQIAQLSPEYGGWVAPARRGNAIANPYITGILPVYQDMRNVIPAAGGRFIDRLDVEQRRRVVVLGDGIKKLLFADEDPVGQRIVIGETPFLVVGEMLPKVQESSFSARDEDRVFIPLSTYAAVFGARHLQNLVYRARDPELSPAVQTQVREVLARRKIFDPEDRDAVRIWDTTEMERLFKYIFLGFDIFLGIVGSFTLIVGGIGVANIMFVVVRERTREIGIKRSLGARRRDVLLQFLMEGLLIVAVGALLGFLISGALVAVAGMLPASVEEAVGTPRISAPVVAATAALLGAITLLAGLLPARRAANLDPVECLRQGG